MSSLAIQKIWYIWIGLVDCQDPFSDVIQQAISIGWPRAFGRMIVGHAAINNDVLVIG